MSILKDFDIARPCIHHYLVFLKELLLKTRPQPLLDSIINPTTSRTMKVQILPASTFASTYARPQYETTNPHKWIPGGPNDCKLPGYPTLSSK